MVKGRRKNVNANRKEIVCKMTRKRGGNRSRKIERNDVKLQMMKGEGGKNAVNNKKSICVK